MQSVISLLLFFFITVILSNPITKPEETDATLPQTPAETVATTAKVSDTEPKKINVDVKDDKEQQKLPQGELPPLLVSEMKSTEHENEESSTVKSGDEMPEMSNNTEIPMEATKVTVGPESDMTTEPMKEEVTETHKGSESTVIDSKEGKNASEALEDMTSTLIEKVKAAEELNKPEKLAVAPKDKKTSEAAKAEKQTTTAVPDESSKAIEKDVKPTEEKEMEVDEAGTSTVPKENVKSDEVKSVLEKQEKLEASLSKTR